MGRSSERWVHPPLVPRELPSGGAAALRFRVLALLLLLAVVAAFVLLFLKFSNVTGGEDPGIGGLRPPAPTAVSAAR